MFITLVLFIFYSCKDNIAYYHGYVYSSKTKKAIEGLKIASGNNKNLSTYTNEAGYFKIKKPLNIIDKYLIVYKGIDSIAALTIHWKHPDVGKRNYAFIQGRNDTIFINYE